MYFVYDVTNPQFGRTVTTVTEAVAIAEAQSSGGQYKVRVGDVDGHEIGSAFHGSWHGPKPTEYSLQSAHEVTHPDYPTVISHHPHMYPADKGYDVREVRGYDDPLGRGFVVVER